MLIELKNICKSYPLGDGELPILKNINLTIDNGEFVAIMGPSGSGKSTLMNILGCLDKPSSGQYLLNGKNVESLSSDELADIRNQMIGFVFQGFNLLSRTSAIENVELPMVYSGVEKNERRQKAERALIDVGLKERMDHQPSQLSGGQQQRVAIARALLSNPPILIFDEATSALDVSVQDTIIKLLVKLQREKGITYIFICHDLALVSMFSHRIAVMYLGNMMEQIDGDKLSEARHPYTRALLKAVFSTEQEKNQYIEILPGEIPSPLDIPTGCPFRNRCINCQERCASEKPPFNEIEPNHFVACHYPIKN